jgi:two-component system cell cycle response regulator DivK
MNGTALIIDDNKLNLETLAVLLHREGFEAITLTSPRDIYDALAEIGQVDVIFLDLEYPNDDGFMIIDDLKAHPALEGVPVVAYSVHISELQETREAGFDGFIGKPLDVTTFPSQLQRILAGGSVWETGQ